MNDKRRSFFVSERLDISISWFLGITDMDYVCVSPVRAIYFSYTISLVQLIYMYSWHTFIHKNVYLRVLLSINASVFYQHCFDILHGLYIALWRHGMGTLFALLALCEGNPPVVGGFTKRASNTEHFVSLNRLVNKQLTCRWFDTPWRSCDVIVMSVTINVQSRGLKKNSFSMLYFCL